MCAFLGGQLAQDVINVLGGREQPVQNFVVFDGEELKGLVYCLYTDMVEGLREVVEAAAGKNGGNGGDGNSGGGGSGGGRSQHRGMPVPV